MSSNKGFRGGIFDSVHGRCMWGLISYRPSSREFELRNRNEKERKTKERKEVGLVEQGKAREREENKD